MVRYLGILKNNYLNWSEEKLIQTLYSSYTGSINRESTQTIVHECNICDELQLFGGEFEAEHPVYFVKINN